MRIALQTIVGAALLALGALALPAELQGRVVGVTDGDTITLLSPGNVQEKIRLSGIDAPEKGQPFGDASKRNLSDLVFDKEASVDWHKRDRYGRVVGVVRVDGRDVGLCQIKSGLAWHFRRYQNEQSLDDRLVYLHAEEVAREARVGLWADAAPMAPWDWRKK
jgi:endonuclease YncB( thermonuclease family)